MRDPTHSPETAPANSGGTASEASEDTTAPAAGTQARAALGPAAEPVSAAENPAPALSADSPAQARGRRILSTAFVMVGPDGLLTVELRNGRVLVLRDAVLNRKNYCGMQMRGGRSDAKYCGGYDEIAKARPGGPPAPAEPDLAAPNPIGSRDKRITGN